jgi:hypothetical protein
VHAEDVRADMVAIYMNACVWTRFGSLFSSSSSSWFVWFTLRTWLRIDQRNNPGWRRFSNSTEQHGVVKESVRNYVWLELNDLTPVPSINPLLDDGAEPLTA